MKLQKSILFALLPVTILVLGLLIINTPLIESLTWQNQQNPLTVNEEPPGTATSANPETITKPTPEFGTLSFIHLKALENIGPRVAGSDQEQKAGEYIYSVFQSIGYSPVIQQFSAWDENGTKYQSANVIATKNGNSTEEIIVGAHYDSVDVGRGADDNASGVGVMLEVAELVFSLETPYTIRFIAFGSEENDLDGSYYFVGQLSPAELKNIIAMVNLDSLVAGDIAYVYSDEGPKAFLRDWVLNWSAENGFPLNTIRDVDLSDDGWPTADYGPFQEEGIAFAYFEATNWALGERDGYTQVNPKYGEEGHIWHTEYDNSNYLEKTFPGRINKRLSGYSAALFAICTDFVK
jgi:alkaline phosphatase isozyme conversion protein